MIASFSFEIAKSGSKLRINFKRRWRRRNLQFQQRRLWTLSKVGNSLGNIQEQEQQHCSGSLKLGGNMPNTLYHPQNLCAATPRCSLHLSYVSPDSPKLGKKKFDHVLDLKRNIGEPSRCPRWQCFSGDGLFLFLMELSLLGFRSWKQERLANWNWQEKT